MVGQSMEIMREDLECLWAIPWKSLGGPGKTGCEWKEFKQGEVEKWRRTENRKTVSQSLKTVGGNGPTKCQWMELNKMKDASQQEDR